MRRLAILIGVLILLPLACQPQEPADFPKAPTTSPAVMREIADQAAEVDRLKTENDVQAQTIRDLTAREKELAQRVRDLAFLNSQQAKQLEAIGDSPRKRDAWKAHAEFLQSEVDRLRGRIEKLTGKPEPLTTRPSPDSQPASQPETRPTPKPQSQPDGIPWNSPTTEPQSQPGDIPWHSLVTFHQSSGNGE